MTRPASAMAWTARAADALAATLAFAGAFLLAFDFAGDPQFLVYRQQFLPLLPLVVAIRLGAFAIFGLERAQPRYVGARDALALLKAVALGSACVAALGFALPQVGGPDWLLPADAAGAWYRLPIRVLLLEGILALLLAGGWRAAWRMASLQARSASAPARSKMIVVGAGADGAALLHQTMNDPASGFEPAGVVDEAPGLAGATIHGLRVRGSLAELGDLIAETGATRVVVATPNASPELLRRVVAECRARRVAFSKLPDARQAIEGSASGSLAAPTLAPIRIEDLLGRAPARLELAPEDDYLAGARVLVTGAGGSIGAEICRQVAALGPASLVALGRGENSLHELRVALAEEGLAERLELVVGDIRDADAMARLFDRARPEVVFHAAAHKHVALMESAPREALLNNVVATRSLARLSIERGVGRFALVSSDKAARPASVMGATKRIAERCVGAASARAEREGLPTRLAACRFGNVLGSRGSVVPLFQRQLARGGPLTVTHADATRYFMTAREAVALTLHAGALAENGALHLLDMGQPVRVLDLARQMIALAGKTEEEIAIEITGLLPGEKLREDLLVDPTEARQTRVPKVFSASLERPSDDELDALIERLRAAADAGDGDAFRAVLRESIPDATL